MDIYGLFDLVAVIAGIAVAAHLKTKDSLLLAVFFIVSSIISFILFRTEFYEYFQHIFIALSVVFGLSSTRHPVTLGYAMYLILIGLNSIYEVTLYSLYIYMIYAYQLWVVRYESMGSRIGCVWVNRFDKEAHKKGSAA